MTPHDIWKALVAEADQSPYGRDAAEVVDVVRTVVGAASGSEVVPLVVADPRTAAELSAAYLREWRRRRPEAGSWVQ